MARAASRSGPSPVSRPSSASSRSGRERAGSRRPQAAIPGVESAHFDLDAPDTVARALEGCTTAYFLVHGLVRSGDYPAWELRAAEVFAEAAARAGVGRIVYLGGVAPREAPSEHLASRLAVGEELRRGPVPVVELRAAMIVGPGSASFRVCRDLALRLPVMVLPRWLKSRSAPVAVADVTRALVRALEIPLQGSLVADLPGPELLSGEEILRRIARLRGTEPVVARVPVLTPWLSALWLRVVSDADYAVARELVAGLTNDLLPREPTFWEWMPGERPTPFDEAAREALEAEIPPAGARILEGLAHVLARRTET